MNRGGRIFPAIHPPKGAEGMLSALEFALEFAEWAKDRGDRLTHKAIAERWEVDRATAYRWLGAWRAFQDRRALARPREAKAA